MLTILSPYSFPVIYRNNKTVLIDGNERIKPNVTQGNNILEV